MRAISKQDAGLRRSQRSHAEGIRNTPTMKEARGRGQEKAAKREVNMFEMRSPSVACVHVIHWIHWMKSHKGASIYDFHIALEGYPKVD